MSVLSRSPLEILLRSPEVIMLIIRSLNICSVRSIIFVSKLFYTLVTVNRSTLICDEYIGGLSILPTLFYDVLSMEQKIQLENDICTTCGIYFPAIKPKYMVKWVSIYNWAVSDKYNAYWIVDSTATISNLKYFTGMMKQYVQYRRYVIDDICPGAGVHLTGKLLTRNRFLSRISYSIYRTIISGHPDVAHTLWSELHTLEQMCWKVQYGV